MSALYTLENWLLVDLQWSVRHASYENRQWRGVGCSVFQKLTDCIRGKQAKGAKNIDNLLCRRQTGEKKQQW
jgi:hypothetical protein